MIRGKLPTEDSFVKMPALNVFGDVSRLKPGQIINVQLEVVSRESKADALVDFVFLNTDVHFSGMFKAEAFLIKTEAGNMNINSFVNINKLISETCKEFYDWVKDGKIPLDEEFSRIDMMSKFLERYDQFKSTLTTREFSGWLTKYANRNGYAHNHQQRGTKSWSIIRTNG